MADDRTKQPGESQEVTPEGLELLRGILRAGEALRKQGVGTPDKIRFRWLRLRLTLLRLRLLAWAARNRTQQNEGNNSED